ncbi:hypothetical protein B0H12DRAFT_1243722 [Mycena haematopus]|nr:hypothetical protein B0H12DRAFT_1243722 [Mycena haematopus]
MAPSRSLPSLSAVRRLGPASLPPYIHGPARTPQERILHQMCREAEEPERRAANARVCAAKAQLAAMPDSPIFQMEYQHALEDYQDAFGRFIEDEALDKFLKKQQKADCVLRKLEQTIVHPYNDPEPLRKFNTKCAAFLREYGNTFKPTDEDRVAKMRDELDVYNKLQLNYQGDTDRLREVFGRQVCCITVRNPFGHHDPRRVDFDTHLRGLFALFLGRSEVDMAPTLDQQEFQIKLPNPWHDRPDDQRCIALYYQHEIWRKVVHKSLAEATHRARTTFVGGPVAPRMFYGGH